MRRLLGAALLLSATLSAVAAEEDPPEAPEPPRVPGTCIRLVPPDGFEPSEEFAGFEDPDSGSFVRVREREESVDDAIQRFLAKRGAYIVSETALPMGGSDGRLFVFVDRYTDRSTKWCMWIFGDDERCGLVSAVAQGSGLEQFESLTRCVRDAVWDHRSAPDPFFGRRFRLGYVGGLQFCDAVEESVRFTEDGEPDPDDTGKAKFVAGPTLSHGPVEDRRTFVDAYLRRLPMVITEVEDTFECAIDRLTGVTTVARARVGEQDLLAYVVVLFDRDEQWTLVADVDAARRDEFLPKFEGIARTFRRTGFSGMPVPPLVAVDFEAPETGATQLGAADRGSALGRANVVTSPVRRGKRALEVTLDRASGEHQTEFHLDRVGDAIEIGREYYYGFSTYVPDDWEPEPQEETIVRWARDADDSGDPQLAMVIRGNQVVIRRRWAPASGSDTSDDQPVVETREIMEIPLLPDRGRWVDWVFHIRWSTGDDGTMYVWKDASPILSSPGTNWYSDDGDKAPSFRFGIRKPVWQQPAEDVPSTVTSRRIYFDEIRVTDDHGHSDDVSPRDE